MKLKYYLRGMGIGIVVTTILFMIWIPMQRNNGERQSTPPPDTESKTVAQVQGDTQEATQPTEAAESDTEPDIKTPAALDQKPQDTEENKTASTEDKNRQDSEKPKPQENQETKPEPASEASVQPETKKEEKVRIEISGGQYSDTVSRKLQEAGLVDNAEAFNDFLVQKNYDNSILPGVYEIPKGSTYEEIAVLLTTKVE